MDQLISAVYYDAPSAARAAARLRSMGFDQNQISVVTSESESLAWDSEPSHSRPRSGGTALAGELTAVCLNKLNGAAVLAAGPILEDLERCETEPVSGLLGLLMRLGIPDYEAALYEQKIQDGGVLICLRAPEERRPAVQDVLEAFNAVKVSLR